jgi:hypothetical protein
LKNLKSLFSRTHPKVHHLGLAKIAMMSSVLQDKKKTVAKKAQAKKSRQRQKGN